MIMTTYIAQLNTPLQRYPIVTGSDFMALVMSNVDKQILTIDAWELFTVLKVQAVFTAWIADHLQDFYQGEDYTVHTEEFSTGQHRFVYMLSLSTATHIAMTEPTELGWQVRQYFIDAEKIVRGEAQ
jgi:anti-repressor protein